MTAFDRAPLKRRWRADVAEECLNETKKHPDLCEVLCLLGAGDGTPANTTDILSFKAVACTVCGVDRYIVYGSRRTPPPFLPNSISLLSSSLLLHDVVRSL